MVDWNHNGERDAFDFAMDMMVIEEMERASSNKKSTYRSTSGSSDAGDGCFLVTMLFFFGIIVVGVFILGLLMAVEDGSIWLLLVLAAILVGLIYFYQKNSAHASDNIDNTNSNKPLQTELEAEPKTESKQEAKKVSAQNNSKKKTNYSTGSSSSSYNKNTASHTSSYAAAGIAAGTLLLDDSDDDDDDWLNHETARDRLDFELLGTGYDSYDLEWMDEEEREEIMWDNGLDPFDYDFYDLDE